MRGSALRVPANLQHVPASRTSNVTDVRPHDPTTDRTDAVSPGNVERSFSDLYEEKDPKSWRGTGSIPLSPRAQSIFRPHALGKTPDDYLFTNRYGGQLAVGVVCKFLLGFHRLALRRYAASTWLRLGAAVHEVAQYLGDEARTVLTVYAQVLGEGQRRDFVQCLGATEPRSLKNHRERIRIFRGRQAENPAPKPPKE